MQLSIALNLNSSSILKHRLSAKARSHNLALSNNQLCTEVWTIIRVDGVSYEK